MNEESTRDLATLAFQKRVLDEFAAIRRDQEAMRLEVGQIRTDMAQFRTEITEIRTDITEIRTDITEIRTDITEIRNQQAAMARNIAGIDQRLTTLEQKVDERLKETRPIWEAVQEQLQRLVEKFDAVLLDFYELRSELRIHGRRIAELERRVLT